MNVTDTNFFGDFSDGKMTCEFRFTKNAALFNLTMSEVTHIYGEAIAGTDSLDISIENGEQELAFLIFEKGNPNLVFSVIFENGTLERVFPEFEGCVKVL